MDAFYIHRGTHIAEGNIVGIAESSDSVIINENFYRIISIVRHGILMDNPRFNVELERINGIYDDNLVFSNSELEEMVDARMINFYNKS
jgi:hypothetical protein